MAKRKRTQGSSGRLKQRLVDLLLSRSFQLSTKPVFTLASGKKSRVYFNCKPVSLSPEGMFLIGTLLYRLIRREKGWKVSAVGGLTLGADPVSAAIAYTSYTQGKPLEAFVVRKEPKKHGTMKWVEGHVKKGDRVLIIEDVVTSGSSALKAISRAVREGLTVAGVAVLIDRQEGGREAIEKTGLPFRALLTREDFVKAYQKAEK